jgi:dolichyl-diphosphooligosaccharide--protein glycosyltransferase
MYLAPFIGVGVGVLIELLARQLGKKLRLHRLAAPVIAISLMATLFFTTTGYTSFHSVYGPIPPASTIKAILELKERVPQHAAMFTWWDQGYPLMTIGEFATYHDGALHGRMRTTLIAKALVSPRQEEMVALLAYLEEHGFDALDQQIVEQNLTSDQLLQLVFGYPPRFRGDNVYVLYVEDMLRTFGGTSSLGTWDFNRQTNEPLLYEQLGCFAQAGDLIRCKEANIDLARGVITDGTREAPLKATVVVNDGTVVNRIDYPNREGDYLQILMKNGRADRVQVIEERLFLTNFNQQYLLGNYDRRYFEEVYNDFPVARAFRVRNAAED